MSEFVSSLLQWINANPHLAGLATFIISAAESIAIIGTIVPGTVMMTAIGTLAGAGVMPLWSTILWAILGAVVGDGISYWIGYYYKDHLRDVWPFRKYPALLNSGITFFNKHGGKSVFIGRFVGPVRALVPLVAGMLHMKPWRFTIANIISAIGWAPAYMLPGILLGAASLELPPDIAVHAILMLLLIGLFIILCVWIAIKILRLIHTQIDNALTRLWRRLYLSRYFSLITTLLRHYNPHKTYGQLKLAFYFSVTCGLFLYLAAYVYIHGSETIYLNNFFFYLFRSIRTTSADNITLGITLLGESKLLFFVASIISIWLLFTKRWHTAFHIIGLILLTALSVEFFKHAIHSARPTGILLAPKGYSFPSGHITSSTIFFLGFSLLLVKALKQKYRGLIFTIAGIIILAVAISRIYLGAHWFTDIVGGFLLGTTLLMLVILSYNRQAEKNIRPLNLFVVALLTLLVSYSAYCYFAFQPLTHNYAKINWPTKTYTLQSWWEHPEKRGPLYRVNRFGLSPQIMSIEWLGDIETIKQLLLKNGWEIPPDRDWITVLHRISNVQSTEHLPLLSPLYLDSNPVLTLIKRPTNNKKLMVLRLWYSNIIIPNTHHELWVGTVELVPSTYSWIFKRKRNNDLNVYSKLFFATPPTDFEIKKVNLENTHRKHPEKQVVIFIKPKNLE